ncbi:MAG: 5-(carboxyamino)imidazole ribonucleotide synthase [Planctomycetota bacterium]|nr:MAG: 5-(carboxyamino)imidazole ribonucleotide synthase [Planctomycetota bacterium]
MTHAPILPGATIGVLGSGQLGRMFAIAARRMGYRVHVLSTEYDTPTGQVADLEIRATYDDVDEVTEFARGVDVVTFEFENVPTTTIEIVEAQVPVRPGGHVLHTTQNRLREKNFLRRAGLPVTEFHEVRALAELRSLCADGLPAVLKSAAWGYDGKGQSMIREIGEVETAWESVGSDCAILERFVDFECELSVVAARGLDGQFVHYQPILNIHRNHILDLSVSPSGLSPDVCRQAVEITREVFEQLDVVGVLCVEMFLTRDGRLLVNELAPRPHNSGHLTIDAHESCQFEQQVRSVCGLPLGSTKQLSPAAMVNLLGECWVFGEPNWASALAGKGVKLHLYGKRDALPGRKMGHITVLADSTREAINIAREVRVGLLSPPGEVGTPLKAVPEP